MLTINIKDRLNINTIKTVNEYRDAVNENKFTFKTTKPTGSHRSFYDSTIDIKYKGEEVGSIGPKEPFKIKLMVMKTDTLTDSNPDCKWLWVTLKKESTNLDEAKQFLNDNFTAITSKYTLKTKD